MSETDFWRTTVRPKLINFGVLHRIENVIELGTPDVAYCLHRGDKIGISGWIELKYALEWPKRKNTIFKFKHYTTDQADWIEEWGRIGRSCVLAQVENDYLLVPSKHCRELQHGVTQQRFLQISDVVGNGVFPTGRIVRWLTER